MMSETPKQLLPVVIGSMIKDEEEYILEWISHWSSLGVSHFFIYNNMSSDFTVSKLEPLCVAGIVTLIQWPVTRGQIAAFRHCHKICSSFTAWLGFFDTDEFLILHSHQNIYDYLESLNADQVLIPWKNFGFCGLKTKPSGLTIASYNYPKAETKVSVKHFFRPYMIDKCGVHSSVPKKLTRIVFEDGSEGCHQNFQIRPTYTFAQVNHYKRSYAEYAARILKGEADAISNKKLLPFIESKNNSIPGCTYETVEQASVEATKLELSRLTRLSSHAHAYGLHQKLSFFDAYSDSLMYLMICVGNYILSEPIDSRITGLSFYTFDPLKKHRGARSTSTEPIRPFSLPSLSVRNSASIECYNTIDFHHFIKSNYFVKWSTDHCLLEIHDCARLSNEKVSSLLEDAGTSAWILIALDSESNYTSFIISYVSRLMPEYFHLDNIILDYRSKKTHVYSLFLK